MRISVRINVLLLLLVTLIPLFGRVLGVDPEQEDSTPPPRVIRGKNHTDLEGSSGLFKSPNFPDYYPENSNVTWKITVPDGEHIELTFHLLNLENNQYCSWDWIKIFNASNSKELRKLCGYLQQDLVLYFNISSIIVEFSSDGLSQRTGFLASWKAVAPKEEGDEDTSEKRAEGYILTFPQSFTVSSENSFEEACLEVFNVDSKGKIFVNVFSSDNVLDGEADTYQEIDYDPADEGAESVKCFKMSLPSDFKDKYGIVQINGTFEDSDYKILSYKSVKVLKGSPQVLIQTDKREYRPNQKVQFRVIKLDEDLKPSKNNVLNKVFVKSPSRQILSQHMDVELDPRGIGSFEYILDEEPELGDWEILVENDPINEEEPNSHFGSFIVNEAVLPKFEVEIKSPDVILRENDKVEFEVCGIYTHGSKVKGAVNVVFEHKYRNSDYWRAPSYSSNFTKNAQIDKDDSCTTVTINSTELALLSVKEANPFTVTAKFTEEGTGIVRESTVTKNVIYTHAEIDFGDSSPEHILGEFPYVMYLQLREHGSKKPLKGEKVQICARLWKDIKLFQEQVSLSRFYTFEEDDFFDVGKKLIDIKFKETCVNQTTSEEDGSITFGIPLNGLPSNVTKLSVKVSALGFMANETTKMKSTTSKHDVALTHLSNDTVGRDAHRLTIREKLIDDKKVKFDCEGTSDFTVYFQGKMDSTVDLNYVVSSGGSLIASGNHKVKVDSNDTAKYLEGLTRFDELGYINSTLPPSENVLKSYVISLNRPFPMEGKITKFIKLLIYTRDLDTGKTISHVRKYESESCAPKPKLEWNPKETTPGHAISLKIKDKPQALCAYSVIDKSADLIENPHKITAKRIQDLKEDLADRRIVHDQVFNDKCRNAEHLFQAAQTLGLFVMSDKLIMDPSCSTVVDSANFDEPDRGIIPTPVAFVGSSASFGAAPPASKFELAFEDRLEPSNHKQAAPAASPAAANGGVAYSAQEPVLEIRDYFPETWLFDMVDMEDNEEVVVEKEAPHTITTWVAEAFCSNKETGISVADRALLKVSQDFFADINSPYAAKRGEILQVNATVFNKIKQPLPMKLSIEPSEDYSFVNKSEEIVCVGPGGNMPVDFYISLLKLGEVNMTIKAEIVEDESCGAVAESSVGYADVLKKSINVRPEGFPKEIVNSYFLCGEQKDTALEDIVLPESNLVEDSVRAWFGISGDIMAPAVKNLDSLVALPTGCGEQTMIRMVPNIYLLDYLKSIGKSIPALESKAKGFIQTGYDRQNRKFRHRDGGYSIWGPKDTDEEGSMWLTAYVVKAFSQASKYIDVNKDLLKKSVKWIIKRQDFETGCFQNVGYAYSVNSPRETLTSHVLITLFEAKYTADLQDTIDSKVITKALQCLKESQIRSKKSEESEESTEDSEESTEDESTENYSEEKDEDEKESLYALALKAYAVHLLETKEDLKEEIEKSFEEIKGEHLFKELMNKSMTDDKGYLNWQINGSLSRSVEMTAYNTMTLLFHEALTDALSAIRWMSGHRNERGGFVSTQDTVVALQAISMYSTMVYENNTNLEVQFSNKTTPIENFSIDEDNKLLFRRMKINSLRDLKVDSTGEGCYTFSTMVRYNIKEENADNAKFQIRVEGNTTYLHICASYIGERPMTNMVLMEIELLSGYDIVEESVELLLNELNSGVEKYEIDDKDRKLVLYFDGLEKGSNRCLNVEIKQVSQVENLKPALIKIYDYYFQEDAFSTTYIV